jgi:DHA1 family bicyclomycin/chloramphenicol resistance-like MFS transporter
MQTEETVTPLKVPRAEFISMIAGLMALNALAIDIMLPAFPNISASYSIDGNAIQHILLAYVLGFGAAQPVFGPLADRFGRLPPLYFGLVIYVICSLAGPFAPDFNILLLLRFLQGVGAASTRVIALAAVRDTHTGRSMASTMSLVMMVFMTIPIFAPVMGQGILLVAPWGYVFGFMAGIAAVMTVWCLFRLQETLNPDNRRELSPAAIIEGFKLVVSNRISLCYTLATAFYFGSLFGFLNVAQPIYVDIYGLGAAFPIAFSSVAVLMAASSYFNSRIVGRLGMRRLSHGALLGHLLISVVALLLFLPGQPPLWLFMASVALTMPLFGLVGANFNSIAMEPLGKVAGTASSVLGFTQTVGGGLTGALVGQAFDGSVVPLIAGFVVLSMIALVFVLIGERGKLFGATTQ